MDSNVFVGANRRDFLKGAFLTGAPTMVGASAIKLLKFMMSGVGASGMEITVLLVGCVVSFIVSLLVIKALMEYVRKHSFASFGYYRIGLGAVVLIYFLVKGIMA